ncbi:hypothetical protein Btru_044784 [Bulinus truncatus]|nr:hypothetical protein Btru_044784 [Bulinus truncatus]
MDVTLTGKERYHGRVGEQHQRGMQGSLLSTSCAHSRCWEMHHVQKVYNLIAPHYNDVKHRTWPKVNRFLKSLQPGSLVADVGCGNGRYLSVNPLIYKFGSDICSPFLEQARPEGHEIMAADNMTLPYRDAVFDAVCSIGVIHHFSSLDRRIRAVQELARITSTGGKVMIYVWAYEQSKRKFTSQDVLIPWIKPDSSGVSRSKLADMESNASCSVDSSDSQDEPLITDTDVRVTQGDVLTAGPSGGLETVPLCHAEFSHGDRPKQRHLHRYTSFENPAGCEGEADAGEYNVSEKLGESPGNEVKNKLCVRSPPTVYDVDERDIEWSPLEDECTNTNGKLSYPRQLVAECKKLGRLLRELTNKNDCRHSVDCEDYEEEDMYEDSVDDVLVSSGSSVRFPLNEAYAPDGGAPAIWETDATPPKYPADTAGDDESVVSTIRRLDDSYQMLVNSDCSSFLWGSGASQSTALPTTTTSDDATVADESLESNGSSSSSSSSCDTSDADSGKKDLKEETLTSRTTSSKSTFCPFSRSPPEVPSDTSVSESCTEYSSVYSQLNTRLAKLNSNSKDSTCLQSSHYCHCTTERHDSTNDQPPPGDKPPPGKDITTNPLEKKGLESIPPAENRNAFHPLSTKDVNRNTYTEPVKETTNTRPVIHRDTYNKNNTTQTGRHDQLLYLLALRQNLKHVFTKIADAFHVTKSSGTPSAARPSMTERRPPSNMPQHPPPAKAKKTDEVTLQYYREVCFFPPNNQYQSMKSCLHRAPVPKSPAAIQGKRHGFIDVARRLSGAKAPIPQPPDVIVTEENRKLTLSDALTMIGDGYDADSICDKLDSSAKKVFLEMKRVNFGIRQFPCSSVDGEVESTKRSGDQFGINNSVSEIKDAARCAAAHVVDRLHDVKQLTQETVQNGLVQLAQTTLQKGAEQCDSINGSFRRTRGAVENSLAKNTNLANVVSLGNDILLSGAKSVRKVSCENTSNNATVCERVTLDPRDGHVVDNMLDVTSSPRRAIIDCDNHQTCELSGTSLRSADSERSCIIASMSRYYHVFRQGELEALIKDHVPSLLIVDSYYDHANWCVIAQKMYK